MSGKKFPSVKKGWQLSLLAGSFIFLAAGMVMIAMQEDIPLATALFISLIFLFFLFVISVSILNMMAVYHITEKGIRLRSPLHREFIPYHSLHEIKSLSAEEARKIWHSITSDELYTRMEARNMANISDYLKLRKKYKYLTRFCTIMPSSVTGGYEDVNVTYHKTYISGPFLLLRESSGREFLLSPKNREGMIAEIEKYRQ